MIEIFCAVFPFFAMGVIVGLSISKFLADRMFNKLRAERESGFTELRAADAAVFTKLRQDYDKLQVDYAAELNRIRGHLGIPTSKN